jgi:zinc transport system permease protein
MPLTVLTSILLLGRGSKSKIKGDATLAMLSIGALAFGFFLINTFSGSGNITADVCDSLFGANSILLLSGADVWVSLAITVVVVALFLFLYNKIFAVTFDSNFMQATGSRPAVYEYLLAAVVGVVVATSMQLVGSLLTAALIIFPAISAMRVFKAFKSVTICAVVISVLCALFGILAAILFETPVGATIVIANIVVFGVFYLTSIIRRGRPT